MTAVASDLNSNRYDEQVVEQIVDGVWVMGIAVNNNSTLVKGTGLPGEYKKRCRVERTGAATGEFYCALDATLAVPVRLCLFFAWGRV